MTTLSSQFITQMTYTQARREKIIHFTLLCGIHKNHGKNTFQQKLLSTMTPEKTVALGVDNYFVLFPHTVCAGALRILSVTPGSRMCLEKREADSKRLGKIWEHICKIAPRVAETSASTSENSSLDEAFSSIPPPVTYAPDASVSTGVTHVGGFWPLKKVERWSEFRTNVANFDFSGEAKFRAPAFCDGISVRVESDVDTAVGVNICKIMNQLLGPQFVFGKQKNSNFGQDPTISRIIPDYTCRYFSNDDDAGQIIFPIEVVKGLINDEGLSLESTHARDSLRQIYNYMIAVESQGNSAGFDESDSVESLCKFY
ncbi:14372_t:CDS:2 [Gigaspora rosea]|nr:14372_t:CDS:2 [Gigaspora rosea]